MSEFLERHRKKGLLAFLLLLFKRGKGAGPLLLLVALMSFIFILPAGLMGFNIPWMNRLAKSVGLGRFVGDDPERLAQFSDAMREARGSGRAGWNQMISNRWNAGKSMTPDKSTVDMVKPQDMETLNKGNDQKYVKGGGESVNGVLNPDDAKNQQEGVHVDPNELERGLMKSAYAGMFQPGAGGGGDAAALRRGGAYDPKMGLVKNALDGSKAPVVGASGSKGGAGAGKLSDYNWKKQNGKLGSGGRLAGGGAGKSALYQLAASRAYSTAAAAPKCTGACPKEYASNTAAVTFDGTKTGADVLSIPELGDGSPVIPDGNLNLDQANQLEEDMKRCQEAQRTYGPQERALMDKIQKDAQVSQQNCKGGCGGGCQNALKKEQSDCFEYNAIARKIDEACKAIGGGSTEINCN
ncbi:MAG: hypothetical protein HY059_09930 [Proteobacteria bacterium]|nr:hypothetical protein [Pseudomonadota bacterium]